MKRWLECPACSGVFVVLKDGYEFPKPGSIVMPDPWIHKDGKEVRGHDLMMCDSCNIQVSSYQGHPYWPFIGKVFNVSNLRTEVTT